MAKRKTSNGQPLAKVWTSVRRIQSQGERMVVRLRRDARTLIARSRSEVTKEIRDLERRVVKVLRAASEEQVTRLERRVAKLEGVVAELREKTDAGQGIGRVA